MEIFNLDLINVLASADSACGQIPDGIFNLTSLVIMAIQVIVPILLIIWGMIDFVKAVIGGDENKIKDAQKVFIRRLIAAVIVFLMVTIVKLLVNLVGQIGGEDVENTDSIWNCVDQFINGVG